MPYITGLAGGGTSYFVDQNGLPRLYMADNPWGLIPNAGRWSGTAQSTMDAYCNARGAQGLTAVYFDPIGNSENNGAFADGRTWDGIFPFLVNGTAATTASVSGSAVIDLNPAYWTLVDYFLASCAASNLTGFMNIAYTGPGDFATGGALTSLTATQFGQYGTALAARYGATPNIVWVVGNDYFGGEETQFSAILTGLRGGGDTHVIICHNMAESTSRQDFGTGTVGTVQTWGNGNSQVNWCYTYNAQYYEIEYAYGEASPITVVAGDGYFYQGGAVYNGSGPGFDRAMRQEVWWALASGARGCTVGSESTWTWTATSAASVATDWFYVNNVGHIVSAFTGLSGWQNLIPDLSNQLITGGRGTRVGDFTSGGAGGQYEPSFANSYVAASRTTDTTLAVLYFPNHVTITIDQSKLPSGYNAKWMDPVTGATQAATKASSYNSTTPGTNSAGDPDWVLVLSTPPYATWTVP